MSRLALQAAFAHAAGFADAVFQANELWHGQQSLDRSLPSSIRGDTRNRETHIPNAPKRVLVSMLWST